MKFKDTLSFKIINYNVGAMSSAGLKEQIQLNKMRKLKFRAWNKTIKYMAYQGDHDLETLSSFMFHFGNDILMQSIGLQDKYGKEIFEGDLLVDRYPVDEENLSLGYNESFLPVIWCDKQLMWCVDASFSKNGSYLTSLVDYFGEYLEVKGNIYETPEYLPSGSIYGYKKNP